MTLTYVLKIWSYFLKTYELTGGLQAHIKYITIVSKQKITRDHNIGVTFHFHNKKFSFY